MRITLENNKEEKEIGEKGVLVFITDYNDEEEAEAITNIKDYEELMAMLQKGKMNDNKERDFIKTRGIHF